MCRGTRVVANARVAARPLILSLSKDEASLIVSLSNDAAPQDEGVGLIDMIGAAADSLN